MPKTLRVLIVEDRPADAELVLRSLRHAGFAPEWRRVDTEAEFLAQLKTDLDLVLSDYEMPAFSGLRALELLEQSGLEIPLIIVSGTIGEETAVAAMRRGAMDYLLKDRLARLGSAVELALEQNSLRRERRTALAALRESEEQMRLLLEHAPAAIAMFDREMRYLICSRRWLSDYGLEAPAVIGRSHYEVFPEISERWKAIHRRCLTGEAARAEEEEFVRTDGTSQWLHWEIYPWLAAPGQIGGIVIFSEDITARKRASQQNREQLDELLRWQEVMLNREERVQTLKAEVNELLVRQGAVPRYADPAPL
ncbi:MAG TPA: PAS domain-containing protein [Opitutaceae bacterium]|nr:PAS domain-containing protein [Opitutaceae bacterium]